MRDLEDEDDELSLSLFKALVGECAYDDSTISIVTPADGKKYSETRETAHADLPAITLLGFSQNACLDVLEQFLDRPTIEILYPLEIAQGATPGNTTAGKLFGAYLDEAQGAITYARQHLNGTVMGQDPHHSTTGIGRSHRRTDSGLARELEEARRHISTMDAQMSLDREQSAEQITQLEGSNSALHVERAQLESRILELDRSCQNLHLEVEQLRTTSFQPLLQQVSASVQTEDLVKQVAQAEVVETVEKCAASLQIQLEQITTEKAEAIAQVAGLSNELAELKKYTATLQVTNGELEKENTGLKKRAEGFSKGIEKKDQVIAAAKAEAQATKGDCEKAKAEHSKTKSELTSVQAKVSKLEAERQSALKISEELLKDKKKLETELESSKSQTDSVQKVAKKKVDALQKLVDEKDLQFGSISKAALAWLSAQVQVERLQRELAAQTERADINSRDANLAINAIQATLEKERTSWDSERESMNAAVISLKIDRDAVGMSLSMEEKLRELEVAGYTARIEELDQWTRSRWNAVGSECVIA